MSGRTRISPRQLEAFRAFMEVGSVTGAAERLHLSQSAVSKILSGLEYSVGYPLFLREKKRLLPTREARLLQKEVDRIFRSLEELGGFVRDLRNLEQGELSILATPPIGETILPEVMARFVETHPRIRVTFEIRSSDVVNQRIADQHADLGFSMVPFDHPSVHSEVLFHVPACCALPGGHRLASRRAIRAEDLRDEPFISFLAGSRMRHLVDAVFEQRQIGRVMRHEVYASLDALVLVRKGMGVAIVDPLTAARHVGRELAMRPFEPQIDYTFKAMRPRFRDASRLADAFMDELRAALQRMAPDGPFKGLVLPR